MEKQSSPALHRWIALALFLAAAALYAHSAGPGLPAYRDAGEMVVALGTLGVPHPPGYPLYVLAGSLAARVPLGCLALRVEYFSAVCGAGAVALMFLCLTRLVGRGPGLAAAALLAVSNPFWELAAVPEMYSLGALFVVATLYASLVLKNAALTGFLFGLSLGVRLDTLLIAPALAWPFVRRKDDLVRAALFAAVGATVLLYLPLRSLRQPILDWGDPQTLDRFLAAVTRRSYGGGLDLLSQAYQRGENFVDGLALLGHHLVANAGPLVLAFALAGLALRRRSPASPWVTAAIGLALSGPVFIFMANLPVNPHAVAVTQAAFITPMIFIAILAALGVAALGPKARGVALAALAVTVGVNAAHASAVAVRRSAWAARDYTEAVLRSTPRHAVLILHEDVQLFGLWHAQAVERRRPDIRVLATGLSGSPWYPAMLARWPGGDVAVSSLASAPGFAALLMLARPLAAGFETEVPAEVAGGFAARGLVRVRAGVRADAPLPDPDFLARFTAHRVSSGRSAPDFFSQDLLADVARALRETGVAAMTRDPVLAERLLRRAAAQDRDFPSPIADLGFLRFTSGDHTGAVALFDEAAENFERLLRDTVAYRSLPDAVEPVRDGLANALGQKGVALERLGRLDDARAAYERSISVKPTTQAHYNLGVTHWNRDWPLAAAQLERAAALDPSNAQTRGFAQAARRRAAEAR